MRTIHLCLAGLGLGLSLFAGCGDNDELVCAPGTFQDGENCAAVDPNDAKAPVTVASPVGYRKRTRDPKVTIYVDEPASIHYTTDGSEPNRLQPGEPGPVVIPLVADQTTIKFFGVDANGNVEETHTEIYDTDTVGPGPVKDLAISVVGTTANVTWTNPTDADYKGTIVARITDLFDSQPVDGTTYMPTAALSSSVQLLGNGAITQVSDPGRATGPIRYVAWAYDDLGNYSAPSVVETNVGTVDTVATFTFDTDTEVLTPTVVPASLDLTATTAEYASTTITLHLSVKNKTNHYFQGPKALVTSVTNATFGSSDGTANGHPFASLGAAALAPGATKTKDLTFTGAAASTLVTISLDLGRHASLFANANPNRQGGSSGSPRRFIDLGSRIVSGAMQLQLTGRNGRTAGLSHPPVLVAHHFLDIPTSHGLERWDLATMTRVGGAFSSEHVKSLLSDGRSTYAFVTARKRRGAGTLYRLNEALQRTGALQLEGTSEQGLAYAAVSPDRSLLAYPLSGGVELVDTQTFKRRDGDPSTPGVIDQIGLASSERARGLTFFDGSSGIAVVDRYDSLHIIKLGATETTVTRVDVNNGRQHGIVTTPDNKLWIATEGNIEIYNPATGDLTASAYPHGTRAIAVIDGKVWVVRSDRTSIDELDATGAILNSYPVPTTGYAHMIGTTE
jgi:hypothetical protein